MCDHWGKAGIGKEIVAQLLIYSIDRIYVLARSSSKFQKAQIFWIDSYRLTADDIARSVEFMACDLSGITVVKTTADILVEKLDRLDILINNAG
jgi:NAD(P)-dependent dehydrogenase (short-subunit alcohol dehydrogenase family)